MSDSIRISSKFESFSSFSPTSYEIYIKNIDFTHRLVESDLEICGIFKKVKASIKFTSILPIISKIQISLDSLSYKDLHFDKIYEELATNIEKDTNRLINKKNFVEHILNQEDSMGGTNISVTIPHSIQNKISVNKSARFKFSFQFYFDSRSHDEDNIFDSFYIPCFYTPSDFKIPSGGYKPCIWMPCLNRALDSNTWKIKVSVPSDMLCITNGEIVNITPSDKKTCKIWNFNVDHPTNPGNIFIFVGKLQTISINKNLHCYSTEKLLSFIESTIDFLPHFLDYFELTYSYTFPYSNIYIIFSPRFHNFKVFGNVIIMSTTILTTRENIIHRFKNYRIFGNMIAEMIFGTLIIPNTIADLWLVAALNRFIYFNFIKKYLGVCEFYKYFKKEQKRACEFPTSSNEYAFYLTPHVFLDDMHGETSDNVSIPTALHYWYISSHPKILGTKKLWKCFNARCGLTMLSIERMITPCHLHKVITKILSFEFADVMTFNRPSTEFFFSSLLNISGKDLFGQVSRNWLSINRPLFLTVDYSYNRRKSCLEVTIHNEDYEIEQNIPVNISFSIQETDGVFEYTHQIRRDSRKTTFEVSSHTSKSRRPTSSKKIPTEEGRDVNIDFLQIFKSANGVLCLDGPVIYLRVNMHHCTFFGRVRVNQSECAWIHQAYIDSNPLGHLKAIKALKSFPSEISVIVLVKLIKNKQCWYYIRSIAFDILVMIFNKLSPDELENLEKDSHPIDIFKSLFCFSNYVDLPKLNDFSNISVYFFQLNAITSLSHLKMIIVKDPTKSRRYLGYEILRSFFEYNDNISNIFSDCCYRARLLKAIGESLDYVSSEQLEDACSFVVSESINSLKIDQLEKYPHYCVSLACIFNIFKLQKIKYLNFSPKFFEHYISPGIDLKLRLKCFEIAVQFLIMSQSSEMYRYLLYMISCDPSLDVRFNCAFALQKHPIFQSKIPESLNSKINTGDLQQDLLKLINIIFSNSETFSLYHELSDFYNCIYGEGYHLPSIEESMDEISASTELKNDGIIKFVLKSKK